MSKEREALTLALEALESGLFKGKLIAMRENAITAIKEALAQPEQEPVAKLQVTLEDRPIDIELAQYKRMFEAACSELGAINEALGLDPNDGGAEPILFAIEQLRGEPQEPVAWMVYTLDGQSVCVTDNPTDFTPEHRALPLYTTPPQRKPLTDEQERKAFEDYAVRTICNPVELQQGRLGGYTSQELNYLWRGWKARAAHGIKGEQ